MRKSLLKLLTFLSFSVLVVGIYNSFSQKIILPDTQENLLKVTASARKINQHDPKTHLLIEDEIKTTQAQALKSLPESSSNEVATEIAKSFNLGSLNEQILKNVKKLAPDAQELHQFVQNYPFEEKFIQQLENLHPEDLNIIAELEKHEISQTLSKKDAEINKLMKAYNDEGKFPKLSTEKEKLIQEITSALNTSEANQLLIGSILETSLSYSLTLKHDNLNQAEIQAMANEQANAILNSRKKYIEKSSLIPYSVLTKAQLKEYADYLQKVEAHKATRLSTGALIPVFSDFSKGIIDLMRK